MALLRREDRRLVTGTGRYTADCDLPGQLHAAVLRSPHPAARIGRIDAAAARVMPGVHAIITGEDVAQAGMKSLVGGTNAKDERGAMRKPFHPVLAQERVAYVGQPVAFVVAATAIAAQDAVECIDIDYQPLPAVVTVTAALAPRATRVHEQFADNVAIDYRYGDAAAVDAAFARAARVTRMATHSQRLAGNPMELRACVAAFDPASGRTTLYAPSQGPLVMRGQIGQVAGIATKDLDLELVDVGGSFGIRSMPYPEYFLAMLSARRLGRPVKWVGSRGDVFLSDYHGRALDLAGEVAMDADGRFLAFRWHHHVDLGAYAGSAGAFIGTNNIIITAHGVYAVPLVAVRSTHVYTNTVPVSAYRGAGRPDIACAIERLVDQAAFEHGFDAIALRKLNYIRPSQMPYKTATGLTYDCGDFPAVLDHALVTADLAGFPARRAASEKAGRLRGFGVASYLEAGGAGAVAKDQTAATIRGDGRVEIHCLAIANGQSHETTFVQLFAGELGIDPDLVVYAPNDPRHDKLIGNGTGGSRTAGGQGSSFKRLAAALIERARPHAAAVLGTGEVTYAGGRFSAGGKSVTLAELAKSLARNADGTHPLDCEAEAVSPVCFPNGCHIAEIEIDRATGVATLAGYTAVDDLGNVLQPKIVEGQLHGGVAQGWGQVFAERVIYDESGQLTTASFMDYAMPRAGWLRGPFTRDAHPVPTATNLMGAKGVGEAGCSGSLPALMNALMDAVRPAGVTALQMPVTAPVLWQALRDAEAK